MWLDITAEDLNGYSPLLSDKKALRAEDGFEKLIRDICIAVRDVKFRNLNREIAIAPINWKKESRDAVCLFGFGRTLAEGDKLPTELIIGQMARPFEDGGAIVPENLMVNTSFVNFLHSFVARESPTDEQAITKAKVIGTGRLLVIDGRQSSSRESVNPEQVIGSFQVDRSKMVQGSYRINPDYSVFTEDGFFRLPKTLEGKLSGEVNRIIAGANAFRGLARVPNSRSAP
ncbi:hypothetical protein E1161_21620 [Saccharopolyspora aridisoli]|uniref:Uncharacterized protein n=1 Tax=Saccharopolyspora aridisoli TaxID=2530385 RepID=A0A4R4UCH9_9PSEU|nr:hypothetical protein [Saccharopolyspora aridisoli]TDC89297.1 hypothetical protein E1161_21620 [Saccharopolyspora aridisoli]